MNELRYPHIDKVWEKDYVSTFDPSCVNKTVYTAVLDNNIDHLDDRAIRFFHQDIDFKTLFDMENATSKALREYGAKDGSYVTACVAGIPELAYLFYACSKIGAVTNLISPFFDKDDLIERIEDCESNILVVMDSFYPAIKDAIKHSRIKNIIILPTLNSTWLRFLKPSKIKPEKHSNEVLWNQFIADGKYQAIGKAVAYEKNKPLAMVYSSGTTRASKGILLSNDSFYNTAMAYPHMGVDITRGQMFYQIIPPWFSTGISICINLPLTYGCSVLMDPRFERDVFIKNVLKEHPTYTLCPTSMYEGLLDPKLVNPKKKHDLSFWKYPFEGGEPLRKEVATKINAVLRRNGCKSELLVGYGQCECGATITSQIHGMDNTQGSVGIPLPGSNVAIVDDDMNYLGYNERGNIIVDTKSSMIHYFNNEKETEKYFYYDENGVKWNCTGDIGYINEQGELFILGRASDFTMISGRKVYNFDVEDVILSFPEVKNVDVLPYNEDGKTVLAAHIILEEGYASEVNQGKKDLGDLFDCINDNLVTALGMDYVVHIFKIRDSFPYAKSGKRDIKAMQAETDGFINHKPYMRVRK